jgi:hypothetical protein
MRLAKVTLNLGVVTAEFEIDRLEGVLGDILREMRTITGALNTADREMLRHLMSRPSGSLKVIDIYPNFTRESDEHTALRRLREAQFIRPLGNGNWQAGKFIEIKSFGRLMWEAVGEQDLFTKL